MLLIYLVTQFSLIYSSNDRCVTYQDEHRFEISIGERLDLNMKENFDGPNLRFSLVGASSHQFTIQQRMHLVDIQPIMENFVSIKQWGDNLAILSGDDDQYKISYGQCNFTQAPVLQNFVNLASRKNCIDIESLNSTTFVVLCQGDLSYSVQYVSVDSHIEEDTYVVDENPTKILLYQIGEVTIITRIGNNCYIDTIYKRNRGEQLNKETLENLLEIEIEQFNIQSITVLDDTIIILDKLKHLFYLRITVENERSLFVIENSIYLTQQPKKITAYMNTWLEIIVIAAVTESNIVFIGIDKQIQIEQSLDFENAQMQASDQFLAIYDQKNLSIYQFSESQKVLMFDEAIAIKQFVFNSNLNDFLIVTENNIARYVLSQGYLILIPPKEENTEILGFTVVASTNSMECEARVSYIVLRRMNSTLIKPFSQPYPFPKILFYPLFPSRYQLNEISISGPNQQAKVANLNNEKLKLNINVDYKQKVEIIGLTLNYTRLVTNIIEFDDISKQKVYFFRQYYIDSVLQSDFVMCKIDKIKLLLTCDEQTILPIQNEVNSKKIEFLYDKPENQIYIYIADGKDVHVYRLHALRCQYQKQFLSLSQEVDSLQFSNNFLILLTKSKVIVKQISGFLEIFLDKNYFVNQGYTKDFFPNDIAVSQIWNLIFIVNSEDILVVQCFTKCILVNSITIENSSRIIINVQLDNRLIIMAEIEEDIVLYEYLIKDPHYIQFQKQFETYHFWLKFVLLENRKDDVIYALAYSPIIKSNVILAIKTLKQLRDALITVFEVDSEKPISSVSGFNDKLIYLNDDDQGVIYLFTNTMKSSIEYSDQINDQFIHNLEIESSFYNIDFPIEQKYLQIIQFVDLQTIIRKKFDIGHIVVTDDLLFPIDNQYFKGMVTEYIVEIKQHIKLQPSLENAQHSYLFKSTILGQCGLNIVENITIILTSTSLEFYNTQFKMYSPPISLDDLTIQLGKIECSKFVSQLIVLRYYNQSGQYVQFFECAQKGGNCYKYGNPYLIKDLDYIQEMLIINTTLITLTREQKYFSSFINAYQIEKQDSNIVLRNVDKIDKQRANQDFIINFINAQSYLVNGVITYKMFFVESGNGLLYVDATQEKYFQFKGNVINLNLQNLLQKNGLFEIEAQIFLYVKFTKNPQEFHQEGYTEFYTLVTTQNSLHYGLIVQFTGSKLSDVRLSFILHTHQLWFMNSKVEILGNYAVMTYLVPDFEEILLAVYKIPKSSLEGFQGAPILVHGAERIQVNFGDEVIIFLMENENTTHLYFSTDSSEAIKEYLLHETTSLIINKEISDTTVDLFGLNYYNENFITIEIENRVHHKGLSLVFILLILIGSIIFLTAIIYCFIKIKNMKRKEQVLGSNVLLD